MRIAFVLYEGMTALDVVGPMDVLSRIPGVQPQLVSVRLGPKGTDNGALQLVATEHLDGVTAPDVIVVPGGLAGTRRAARDPQLLAWLQETAPSAEWVTSVCTGSLVLGAAGLLDGREATTHWLVLEELEAYGAKPVHKRFTVDGNIVTAAGVSAGIDMALWLAGRIAGDDVARLIQLSIEYAPAPPYHAGTPTGAGSALTDIARSVLLKGFEDPDAAQEEKAQQTAG